MVQRFWGRPPQYGSSVIGQSVVKMLARAAYTTAYPHGVGVRPNAFLPGSPTISALQQGSGLASKITVRGSLSLGAKFLGWIGLAYTLYEIGNAVYTALSPEAANNVVGTRMGLTRTSPSSLAQMVARHLFPGEQSASRFGARTRFADGVIGIARGALRVRSAMRGSRRSSRYLSRA